jgi:beta-glucosidase
MPWVKAVPTLVHAWFGGQETGNAIADVLFGRHNPTGRLSVTFPRRLEDTPAFLSYGKGVREMYYGEGVFVGYRYYEKLRNDPLFYFGYGLSYTTFEYSNLRAPEWVDLGGQGEQSFEVRLMSPTPVTGMVTKLSRCISQMWSVPPCDLARS